MSSSLPFSYRVFLAHAAVLTAATVALALSPATVSFPVDADEALVLAAGLAATLAVDLLLVRRAFAPLERLASVMRRVEPLAPGRRVPSDQAQPELAAVASSFNAMLDRLEVERRESARRALAAEEAERRRISRELHDEVGQVLTAVLLRLDHAARSDAPAGEHIPALIEPVRGALDEIRRIATGLRPVALDELGLPAALHALAGDVRRATGIHVAVELREPLPALPADVELVVYRIAQEALTNVARHAGAGRAVLSFTVDARGGRLVVRDDGCGPAEAIEGTGIRGMRERAVLLGARLDVAAAPGGGTAVALEVPAEAVAA